MPIENVQIVDKDGNLLDTRTFDSVPRIGEYVIVGNAEYQEDSTHRVIAVLYHVDRTVEVYTTEEAFPF